MQALVLVAVVVAAGQPAAWLQAEPPQPLAVELGRTPEAVFEAFLEEKRQAAARKAVEEIDSEIKALEERARLAEFRGDSRADRREAAQARAAIREWEKKRRVLERESGKQKRPSWRDYVQRFDAVEVGETAILNVSGGETGWLTVDRITEEGEVLASYAYSADLNAGSVDRVLGGGRPLHVTRDSEKTFCLRGFETEKLATGQRLFLVGIVRVPETKRIGGVVAVVVEPYEPAEENSGERVDDRKSER